MEQRPELTAALAAAVRRVYPNLEDIAFEKEVGWTCWEVISQRPRNATRIDWRRLRIGRLLFDHLCEAQNWRCCYCGVRTLESRDWKGAPSIEHPWSLLAGGDDHPDNMVMACFGCNKHRGDVFWIKTHPGRRFIERRA